MIWTRLKSNCCPNCNSLLQAVGVLDPMFECSNAKCDTGEGQKFRISETRFNEIVSDMYRPKRYQMSPGEYDNLSGLNNLGHVVRSEDYSDRQPV